MKDGQGARAERAPASWPTPIRRPSSTRRRPRRRRCCRRWPREAARYARPDGTGRERRRTPDDPRRRPLRLVHLQPRAADREASAIATEVVKSDAEPAAALAAREPDAVLLSPGPGPAGGRGVLHRAARGPARRDPGARRVPRPSGDRRRLRRLGRPHRAGAREGLARASTRARASSRASRTPSRRAATTPWSCCATTCPPSSSSPPGPRTGS